MSVRSPSACGDLWPLEHASSPSTAAARVAVPSAAAAAFPPVSGGLRCMSAGYRSSPSPAASPAVVVSPQDFSLQQSNLALLRAELKLVSHDRDALSKQLAHATAERDGALRRLAAVSPHTTLTRPHVSQRSPPASAAAVAETQRLRRQLEQLHQQLAELGDARQAAERDADYCRGRHKVTLGKLEAVAAEAGSLRAQFADVCVERDRLLVQLRQGGGSVSDSVPQTDDMTAAGGGGGNDELLAAHAALSVKLELSQDEVRRLRARLHESTASADQQCSAAAAIRHWDSALRERDEFRQLYARAKRQHDAAAAELAEMRAGCGHSARQLQRMSEERDAALMEINKIMSERSVVHGEMDRLQDECAAAELRASQLSRFNEQLQAETQRLREQLVQQQRRRRRHVSPTGSSSSGLHVIGKSKDSVDSGRLSPPQSSLCDGTTDQCADCGLAPPRCVHTTSTECDLTDVNAAGDSGGGGWAEFNVLLQPWRAAASAATGSTPTRRRSLGLTLAASVDGEPVVRRVATSGACYGRLMTGDRLVSVGSWRTTSGSGGGGEVCRHTLQLLRAADATVVVRVRRRTRVNTVHLAGDGGVVHHGLHLAHGVYISHIDGSGSAALHKRRVQLTSPPPQQQRQRGLSVGDRVLQINGRPLDVHCPADVAQRMLDAASSAGSPSLSISVQPVAAAAAATVGGTGQALDAATVSGVANMSGRYTLSSGSSGVGGCGKVSKKESARGALAFMRDMMRSARAVASHAAVSSSVRASHDSAEMRGRQSASPRVTAARAGKLRCRSSSSCLDDETQYALDEIDAVLAAEETTQCDASMCSSGGGRQRHANGTWPRCQLAPVATIGVRAPPSCQAADSQDSGGQLKISSGAAAAATLSHVGRTRRRPQLSVMSAVFCRPSSRSHDAPVPATATAIGGAASGGDAPATSASPSSDTSIDFSVKSVKLDKHGLQLYYGKRSSGGGGGVKIASGSSLRRAPADTAAALVDSAFAGLPMTCGGVNPLSAVFLPPPPPPPPDRGGRLMTLPATTSSTRCAGYLMTDAAVPPPPPPPLRRVRMPSTASSGCDRTPSTVSVRSHTTTTSGSCELEPCSSGGGGWTAAAVPSFSVHMVRSAGESDEYGDLTDDEVTSGGVRPGALRQIVIESSDQPLGISISCSVDGGVFVSEVQPSSLAERVCLQVGDQILEVCGINLRSANHRMAASVLSQCGDSRRILAQYNPRRFQQQQQEQHQQQQAPPYDQSVDAFHSAESSSSSTSAAAATAAGTEIGGSLCCSGSSTLRAPLASPLSAAVQPGLMASALQRCDTVVRRRGELPHRRSSCRSRRNRRSRRGHERAASGSDDESVTEDCRPPPPQLQPGDEDDDDEQDDGDGDQECEARDAVIHLPVAAASPDPSADVLPVRVVGGNAVGVFVDSLTPAVISQRRRSFSDGCCRCGDVNDGDDVCVGDRLLAVNAVDLRLATVEQAVAALCHSCGGGGGGGCLRVRVVWQPRQHRRVRHTAGDRLYVRALFSRRGDHENNTSIGGGGERQLGFQQGDILLVDSTMYGGRPGVWRAWLVDPADGRRLYCGLIPSASATVSSASSAVISGNVTDKRISGGGGSGGSVSLRRSFFRRRSKLPAQQQHQGNIITSSSSPECADSLPTLAAVQSVVTAACSVDMTASCGYERVERLPSDSGSSGGSAAPVVVVVQGPLASQLVAHLATTHNELFAVPSSDGDGGGASGTSPHARCMLLAADGEAADSLLLHQSAPSINVQLHYKTSRHVRQLHDALTSGRITARDAKTLLADDRRSSTTTGAVLVNVGGGAGAEAQPDQVCERVVSGVLRQLNNRQWVHSSLPV